MRIVDGNNVPILAGISSSDGTTYIPIQANPSTHGIFASNGLTGSDLGNSPRSENRQIAFYGVSSVDGVTPVAVYCDATTKRLLINSS